MSWLPLRSVWRKDFDGCSDEEHPWVMLVKDGSFSQVQDLPDDADPEPATGNRVGHAAGSQGSTPTTARASAMARAEVGGVREMSARAGARRATPSLGLEADGAEGWQVQGAVPENSMTREQKQQLLHDQGRCRPCCFHARPDNGCRHGRACDYCHLCDKYMHQTVKRKMRKGIGLHRVSLRDEDHRQG
eukprot:TRINITY_DN23480_c0_g2_i2.p1 TRINITY_DN23480_c0_g2~~TRINITY_DN23480_c0_g2_i2.p1  ORF type:complete len:189 (-),score=9.41 TRINITY_DN23480_c0_g2_i2:277-843(-)